MRQTSTLILSRTVLALVLLSCSNSIAQVKSAEPQGVSTFSRPFSASVVVTTIAKRSETGPAVLELMILWRGNPGWFLQQQRRLGGSLSGGWVHADVAYGSRNLSADFLANPRTVRIEGKPIELSPSDANVVLVDKVDTADALAVDQTLRVDPTMPQGELLIDSVLRRSQAIVDFLKCDLELSTSPMREAVRQNCRRLLGK